MKSSSAVALLIGGAIVVGGIAWAVSSSKEEEEKPQVDPRIVRVYEDQAGVWSFVIYAGPSTPGVPPVILTPQPIGPFASKEAAETAGANWLAEHPLV